MRIYSQIRMDETVVPIEKDTGYRSIAEMFQDDQCPTNNKLATFVRIAGFETINSVTKDDLHAIIKWLNETYDFEYDEFKPRLV